MSAKTVSRYVTRHPQILSGEPIITGTRTPVRDRETLGKLDDEQLSQTFAIAFTQQFRSVSQKF